MLAVFKLSISTDDKRYLLFLCINKIKQIPISIKQWMGSKANTISNKKIKQHHKLDYRWGKICSERRNLVNNNKLQWALCWYKTSVSTSPNKNDKLNVSTKILHVSSVISVISGSVWIYEWRSFHGSVLTELQGQGRVSVRREELHRCGDISRFLLQVILVLVISNCSSHHRWALSLPYK